MLSRVSKEKVLGVGSIKHSLGRLRYSAVQYSAAEEGAINCEHF